MGFAFICALRIYEIIYIIYVYYIYTIIPIGSVFIVTSSVSIFLSVLRRAGQRTTCCMEGEHLFIHLTILNESMNPAVVSDAVVKQIFCTRLYYILQQSPETYSGFSALHSLNALSHNLFTVTLL